MREELKNRVNGSKTTREELVEKRGEIILQTPSMILKWIKCVPESKKLNIICLDNKELRSLTADDYELSGDIMQLYIPSKPRKNAKKGRFKYVARQLARMINKETSDETNIFRQYTSITFFAVGECGLCAVNIPEYLEENRTIRIVTIATPFFGTHMADEKFVKSKTSFFERIKEYGRITRIYHLPDEELSERHKVLLKVDNAELKRHRWFNVIASSEQISEFAHKVFGADLSDGIVPTDSQNPESENVDRTIYITASHEEALFETIEYFNKAISDKALLQPIVDFKG